MPLTLDSPQQRCWLRRRLLLCLLAVLLPFAAYFAYALMRMPGAALLSYNYTDRPIFSFWVNDFWGGNLAPMGEGGVMCCRRLNGPTAKVVWILDMTKAQQLAGAKEERHEIELPMPPRKRSDDTLHVLFFPGNRIELIWSASMLNPLQYPNGIPEHPPTASPLPNR